MILLPADAVRAARGLYDTDGELTLGGVGAVASLERLTAERVAVHRREQIRKAWKTTRGGIVLTVCLALMFSPLAGEGPGLYWTCFALTTVALGRSSTSGAVPGNGSRST